MCAWAHSGAPIFSHNPEARMFVQQVPLNSRTVVVYGCGGMLISEQSVSSCLLMLEKNTQMDGRSVRRL